MAPVRCLGWMMGLMLLPLQGQAQEPRQKAVADAAFDEGKRLMADQRYAEACPKLAESQRLDPASSTLLWLGECYEKAGKLASAWTTFREAAALAARQGKSDREKLARERVTTIEPLVPRILLRPPSVAGLALRLDGVDLGAALWETPIPIDAGAHMVEMSAPGKKPRSVPIQAPQGQSSLLVVLPEMDAETAATSSAPAPHAPPGRGSHRVLAFVLGGAGLALGAGGTALQLSARSMASDSRDRNDPALYNDASRRQLAAIASLITGGALLTGGIALLVLSSPSSTALRAGPLVTGRGPGLWMEGSF